MTTISTMLTSSKMLKGLLLGAALLMLLLALSCGSSDSETEEADTVAEAMAAANEVADQQERAIAKAVVEAGQPIVFTSLALLAGFSVLLLASFRPVVFFGGLTAVTMINTTLGALFVLPVLLARIRPFGSQPSRPVGRRKGNRL